MRRNRGKGTYDMDEWIKTGQDLALTILAVIEILARSSVIHISELGRER